MDIDPEAWRRAAASLDQQFGLEVLWLYGSAAKGTDRPGSDLDLGALFTRRPSGHEMFKAGPILGMQVLRYGRSRARI